MKINTSSPFHVLVGGQRSVYISCLLVFMALTFSVQAQQLKGIIHENAEDLVRKLVGSNAEVSNISVTSSSPNQRGFFENGQFCIGMETGVVLNTGDVSHYNPLSGEGYGSLGADNVYVNSIKDPNEDASDLSLLEFDILVPAGYDVLDFKYAFFSEEYPSYNNSYPDAFGLFISGPGIVDFENIARVPGTNELITLKNISSTTNSQYYVSPIGSGWNGGSVVLTATRSVTPGGVYHLVFAVIDVRDNILNTAVYLQANTLGFSKSTDNVKPSISATQISNTDCPGKLFENKGKARFTISISTVLTTDYTVYLNYEGSTATNGVDYMGLPSQVIIPKGTTSTFIDVIPVQDQIFDPNEAVTICVTNAIGHPYDCKSVGIADWSLKDQYTLCVDELAPIQVEDYQGTTYTWTSMGLYTIETVEGKKYLHFLYPGTYTLSLKIKTTDGCELNYAPVYQVGQCNKEYDCCPAVFSPNAGKYHFSGWIAYDRVTTGESYKPYFEIEVTYAEGTVKTSRIYPKNNDIEGWHQAEDFLFIGEFASNFSVRMVNPSSKSVYFDDVRLQPFSSSMKGYVYDQISGKMMSELDENNYATFFEYDEEGKLIRIKKETERGVMTIQESNQNSVKP